MQSLQTLINLITKSRNIHISFLDITGILDTPYTKVDLTHKLHSNKFCEIAKSTPLGRRICIRCKRRANKKAKTGQSPFGGHCCYGLYEVAFPVLIDNSVVAVVYVGNAILNKELTCSTLKHAAQFTGVDENLLYSHLKECECITDADELFQIAEIVGDYLKLVYKNSPKTTYALHWLVYELKRYADSKFETEISLHEFASIYNKNEKYIGRLFKKQMGIDFHKYCLQLQIEKAEILLLQSNDKIIDIAFDCGFNNISYFNRVFFKKHGVSPSKYRLLHSKNSLND